MKKTTQFPRSFENPRPHIPQENLPRLMQIDENIQQYQGVSSSDHAQRLENEVSPEARESYECVCALAQAIKEEGGTAFLVGGAVRDEITGGISRDFDVEVYGIEPKRLEEIVARFGVVKEVGKAFGILKMTDANGFGIDVSLPRRDSKTGRGHSAFTCEFDQNMSLADAMRRRDFTFNSLAKDPLTGKIYDAFGGVEDMRTRTLRVTDKELFRDDPLRVMRAAQFVARMGLRIDAETMLLMQDMLDELIDLPHERMKEEWEKLLLKPDHPSMGLQALMNIGVIHKLYPELAGLREVSQDCEQHPEGDVWVHTLMVVDAARELVRCYGLDDEASRVIMWSALCHDLSVSGVAMGKQKKNIETEFLTRVFLEKIGLAKNMVEKIVALAHDHLAPGELFLRAEQEDREVTDGEIRALADRLHPATIEECLYIAEADILGRGPFIDPAHAEQFLLPAVSHPWDGLRRIALIRDRARALGILQDKPYPPLRGSDLIAIGFLPGKKMGELIAHARDAHFRLDWSREKILRVIFEHREDIEECLEEFQRALSSSAN